MILFSFGHKGIYQIEQRVRQKLDRYFGAQVEKIRQIHLLELNKKDESWRREVEKAINNEQILGRRAVKSAEIKMAKEITQLKKIIFQKDLELKDANEAWELFKHKVIDLEQVSESISAFLELEYRDRIEKYQKIEGKSDQLDSIVRFIKGRKGKKIEFKLKNYVKEGEDEPTMRDLPGAGNTETS